jgi:hypothetical protein
MAIENFQNHFIFYFYFYFISLFDEIVPLKEKADSSITIGLKSERHLSPTYHTHGYLSLARHEMNITSLNIGR